MQELLLGRKITMSHETLHDWNQKFAAQVSFQTGTIHLALSGFAQNVFKPARETADEA